MLFGFLKLVRFSDPSREGLSFCYAIVVVSLYYGWVLDCIYILLYTYLHWFGPLGIEDLSFYVFDADFVCPMCCCGLLLANESMIQVRNLGFSDLEIEGVVSWRLHSFLVGVGG